MENYFKKRNNLNLKRIEELLSELPLFCEDFFVGIESSTTPLTRLNYAYDLRIFFDYLSKNRLDSIPIRNITLLDLDEIDVFFLEKFLSYLSSYTFQGRHQNCNDRAKARKLSTLRSLFKYFFNKDLIQANIAAKVKMPKIKDKEIIRLEKNNSTNEIAQLLDSVEFGDNLTQRQKKLRSNLVKLRDVALFSLFLGTGIRISELVGLDDDDLDLKNMSFKITRKGGNKTILYYSDEIANSLNDYIKLKNDIYSDEKISALFISSTQNKRISVRAVQILVKKYARPVTPLKNITPHKLRSTFGTQLYRNTGDIYFVADILGHKDINTTKKHYAAISEDLKKSLPDKIKLRD